MSTQAYSATTSRPLDHPLTFLTGGGWIKACARLLAAAIILGVVLSFTGEETWTVLMKLDHLPYFVFGAALLGVQRVLRVLKWSLIVEKSGLTPRRWTWLVRIQFIGLLGNLLVPVSEGLKIWAVSSSRKDIRRATETIVLDSAMLTVAVGGLGLLAGLFLPGDVLGSLTFFILAMTAVAGAIVAFLIRRHRAVAATWLLSLLESLCLLGAFGAALAAIGAPASPLFLAAAFPLLYLSHLFMLTPSGLGVREAVFAVVFGALSATPTEAAVAMGLFVSAMLLVVAIGGGGLSMLWPGEKLSPKETPSRLRPASLMETSHDAA